MLNIPLESAEDLYNYAPCGYFDMTRDRKIVRINETLLGWLGYSREEVLGKATFNDWLNTGTRLYIETHFAPMLHMQGYVKEIAFDVKIKDGSTLPVLINSSYIKLDEKQVIIRSTVFDATHRRRYEKELLLAKKNSELLAEELKIANEELRQFAYAASHDLKAPLTNVMSLLDIIKNRIHASSQDELKPVIEMAHGATSRMSELIKSLLEHAVSGKKESSKSWFAWNEAMEEVRFNLQMIAFTKNAQIIFEGSFNQMYASRTDMIRLVQNLISNGIKYCEKDRRPVVLIRSKEYSTCWEIIVEDNGIGIDPAHQKEIFKPFFRLHSSKDFDGSGIGLATCKNIIEQHNGSVVIESEKGSGSKFIVKIPKTSFLSPDAHSSVRSETARQV